MRVLLDECIPRQFKSCSHGEHDCATVPEAGLAGKTNGELLGSIAGVFDVLVTLDKGVRFQQKPKWRNDRHHSHPQPVQPLRRPVDALL
jgi:hypothetical protein